MQEEGKKEKRKKVDKTNWQISIPNIIEYDHHTLLTNYVIENAKFNVPMV